LKIGDIIGQPDFFKYAPLQVQNIISDHHGFRAVVLVPAEQEGKITSSAMILFQGTVPKFQSILDDMVHTIGSRSFQRNAEAIKKTIEEVYAKFGPVTLLGHSMGAAIGQLATLEFSSLVTKCRLYNGPGIQYVMETKEFEEKMQSFDLCKVHPKVVHIWHPGDLVPYAGGKHLPADKMYIMGEIVFKNVFKAHSELTLSNEECKRVISYEPQITGGMKTTVEYLRYIARAVPWMYDKIWGSSSVQQVVVSELTKKKEENIEEIKEVKKE